MPARRPRSVQHGRGDASDTLGSGDRVDFNDLVAADGETEDGEWPPAEDDDRSRRPVDQGRPHLGAREGAGAGLTGDRRRATEYPDRALGAEVLSKDDIGVEDRDEPVEVAAACG